MRDSHTTKVNDHADGGRSRYLLMMAPCVFNKALCCLDRRTRQPEWRPWTGVLTQHRRAAAEIRFGGPALG
jgi:hypothetical protein